ncbi:hypothetical protein F5884DRAFT_672328 [Xylogone sp. PMI_703]|nr:hypothetical protein F5884DRAFT_672328 [Xylogone sp. PMI_703]
MGLDNANPTVLSVTELTSRRRRSNQQSTLPTKGGIEDLLIPTQSYSIDPYYMSDFSETDSESNEEEPIDEQEIYDLIAPISDPEHPLSLESLGVVNLQDVKLTPASDPTNPASLCRVTVEITPTVAHCSLATVIGLGVRVRLEQALPPNYRVEVKIKKGSHAQSEEVNKQLADKERVAAALENANLLNILRTMMKPCLQE